MEDWKEKLGKLSGIDYSNSITETKEERVSTFDRKKTPLRIEKEKRRGKLATIISGFNAEEDIKTLAKTLKLKCGAGGSFRGDEILIQGDVREKAKEILQKEGYNSIKLI